MPALRLALLLIAASVAAAPVARAADAPAAVRTVPLAAGEAAPDFTLAAHSGGSVTLSAEWKRQPVVLIFYRGHW